MELTPLFDAIDDQIRAFPGDADPAELFMLRMLPEGIAIKCDGVVAELLRRCWSRRPDALAYTLDTRNV